MISNKIKSILNKGLLITGLLAITLSCSDVLELEPKTTWAAENFYQTENDINAALAGIHSFLSSYTSYGGVLQQMNVGTDEAYKLKSWNERYPTGIYGHNAATEEIRDLYRNLYGGINNCNNFIKYINPDNFEDEAVYNNYLAEAHFLRGFMYYHLTIWYNEVPIRLEPTLDQSSNHVAPSPVKDVYEQILSDLTFAADNLYDSFDGNYVPGHANKMAAHAMLAKTYLKAAGYPLQASEINGMNPHQAAKDHCAIIMNDGNYALNSTYKDVFLNYIQNRFDLSETLFEIVYVNGTALGLNIGGRIGTQNGLFYGIDGSEIGEPTGSPEITPAPLHYRDPALTEANYIDEAHFYEFADSLRQHWNSPNYGANKNQWNPNGVVNAKTPFDWGFTPGKFRRWDAAFPWDLAKTNEQLKPVITLEAPEPVNQNFTGINYPILRFSDVLLMFAEAENELNGPTAEAQGAIDLVRNRAGLDNLAIAKPAAIAGEDAFFNEIVDERLRELCFEGHRKHDLIRWGLLEEKIEEAYVAITQEPGYGPSHAFRHRAYDNFKPSIHTSLPYPEQEVLINNLLDQKSGW